MKKSQTQDAIAVAVHYHDATKHHFHRYARSVGYLDWANQPNPFREFNGSPRVWLPLIEEDATPPYDRLFQVEPSGSLPVTLKNLAALFEMSMGLSAWKEFQESRWSLRVNPSSGNLHPTEAYLVHGPLEIPGDPVSREAGRVCHYSPQHHALEIRREFYSSLWASLTQGLPENSFLIGVTSIHWREAWKYGERAFRYCQHDVGHATAALTLAARSLGWEFTVLQGIPGEDLSHLLGLSQPGVFLPEEPEEPDLLAVVSPSGEVGSGNWRPPKEILEQIGQGPWLGTPNRLSEEHYDWPIIEAVATVTRAKQPLAEEQHIPLADNREFLCSPGEAALREASSCPLTVQSIVNQRRSAVAMDGRSSLPVSDFYRMLARILPVSLDGGDPLFPWNALPWEPSIHLALFIHRVEGLAPGLYLFPRTPRAETDLRETITREFEWERPAGCPEPLPLVRLQEGDARHLAGQVSCGQDIASDGAFSLGMLAEFEDSLARHGAHHYRRLFWEAGFLGQILYLEAEASGLRATGIGCFFDDPVHEVFGLPGHRYQSLYHFTVGGPIEDTRLLTRPPYSEERKNHPIGREPRS